MTMIKFIMDSLTRKHSCRMELVSAISQMDPLTMDSSWMAECMEKAFLNGLQDLENSLRFTMANTNMDSKVAMENSLSAQEIFTRDNGSKAKDMGKE